jgi:hypothetical protein
MDVPVMPRLDERRLDVVLHGVKRRERILVWSVRSVEGEFFFSS